MKVSVDAEKCEGHLRCIALCPEVFDSDLEGFAVVVLPDVPEEHEEAVRRAVLSCPERAIVLHE